MSADNVGRVSATVPHSLPLLADSVGIEYIVACKLTLPLEHLWLDAVLYVTNVEFSWRYI